MVRTTDSPSKMAPWRVRTHEILFEADTLGGKIFDVALLVAILLSVLVVILDSVDSIHQEHENLLVIAEWVFTVLFTIEYVLRLMCVRKPLRYANSFFGVVDLLAVLPSYVAILLGGIAGTQSILVVRALRLLRVFRVFKLARYLTEAGTLRRAIVASRAKITVFLATILIAVIIMGTAMHVIEGPTNDGFDSIPQSMYWGIVTLTTVGYGDAAPQTPPGKAVAALMMIIGYSLIIVPTGIFSAELVQASRKTITTQACPDCMREGHDADAVHCKHCGGKL